VTLCVSKICLISVVALMMLSGACLAPSGAAGNKLTISSLQAEYPNVYPKAWSAIKCVTSDPDGQNVQFTWSTDGGAITGEGSTVTWQAPNEYGDYHVMVNARDDNGGKAEAVVTLSVIPRPYRSCCGR
jgi:hypothetical protein